MTYLILDTNIWIYLANGFTSTSENHDENVHFTFLTKLVEKIDEEEITLVVNDIIIQEWDRNNKAREAHIDQLTRRKDSSIEFAKTLEKDLENSDKTILREICENFKSNINERIARNKFHIDQVDELLKSRSIVLKVSDEVKKRVSELGFSKKAPFHRNKNCTADAAILLSSIEYLRDRFHDYNYNAIFVTNNTDDFCISKNDLHVHTDLQELFSSVNLQLATHLGSALELSQEFSKELEKRLTEARLTSAPCQSVFCKDYDTFIGSIVELNQSFEYLLNGELPFDPNQLTLDLGENNMPRLREDRNIFYGDCVVCNTTHFECPICGDIFAIDDFESMICPYCGTQMRQTEVNGKIMYRLLTINSYFA